MAAAAAPPPPPDARSLVAKLRKHSFAGFVVLLLALSASQLLRAVKPAAGTFDDAAQMPWVRPHLQAMQAAWRAAGGAAAPSGWEDAVLYANTTRLGTSGLAYEDVELGAGAPVHPTEIVALVYKLYVGLPAGADGAPRFVFSSADAAAPVVLRASGHGAVLLEGQLAAVEGMRHGGRRRALLPPRLGFGAAGNERVPAFSTLLCFMELLPKPEAPPSEAEPALPEVLEPRWEDDLEVA